jgi:hypothetical protein
MSEKPHFSTQIVIHILELHCSRLVRELLIGKYNFKCVQSSFLVLLASNDASHMHSMCMMSSIIEAILSDFQFVTYSGNVKIYFDQSVSENQK